MLWIIIILWLVIGVVCGIVQDLQFNGFNEGWTSIPVRIVLFVIAVALGPIRLALFACRCV